MSGMNQVGMGGATGYTRNYYGGGQLNNGGLITPMIEQEDDKVYVNAKQYTRILKRRKERLEYLERIKHTLKLKEKKPYIHESRHRHAVRRPRGEGGRFLKKGETRPVPAEKSDLQFVESNNSFNTLQ